MLPALWEIIIPLILAVLLGIFIGWLMWRWRRQVVTETEWLITQGRVRTLEGELADAHGEMTRLDDARAQAAVDLDDARKAVRGVEADLESARADVDSLTTAKADADARVASLDADLTAAKGQADELSGQISTLTADLDTANTDLGSARAAADAARADVDAAKAAAAADLDAARASAAADADAVKVAALADLDAARRDADSAQSASASLQADLDAANAAAAQAQADADAARSATAAVQADLDAAAAAAASAADDCDARVASLTADLDAARARIEELEAADDPATNWQQGVTTLGTPGAAHKDDLKVVNGIGPKMEGLLNSFGIQSWEQLAWLSAEQVQAVDDALQEFPGRIERDEWVPQAKDLIVRFPDRADRPDRTTFLNRSED